MLFISIPNECFDDFTFLDPEDVAELKSYEYSSVGVDEAIQRVKEYNAEIERLENLYNERIERMKAELENKTRKLQKRKDWDVYNIGRFAQQSPDLKSTKTQYKLSMLSGDVIIKKEKEKLIKPKVTAENQDEIKQKYKDYLKTKYDINWEEMKKSLMIKDGKVFDMKTNKEVDVEVEIVPSEVVIK